MIKRPMKAGTLEVPLEREGILVASPSDFQTVPFPVIASPKLDGFRCVKINGLPLSSTFKPIRNRYTNRIIRESFPDNLDGELILFDKHIFTDVSSAFSSYGGEPIFQYAVFDILMEETRYDDRLRHLEALNIPSEYGYKLEYKWLFNAEDAFLYEKELLERNEEGMMLRKPSGLYKSGRSTFNEFYLMKVKRFAESDAVIIGFKEQHINNNDATIDNLGLSRRSSHKDNMLLADTLGSLIVKDCNPNSKFFETEFSISSGLDSSQKSYIWSHKNTYMGRIINYKYQKAGSKDAPRIPVFLKFRE